MVYSTCTITLEENEGQVAWFLEKYPNMELVSQEPYHLANFGLKYDNLKEDQLNLCQRFGPFSMKKFSMYETIGFFIAKLIKK